MNKISTSEYIIMNILWETESPLNRKQIANKVKDKLNKEWKLATVSTFISRLRNKGFLVGIKIDGIICFKPTMSKIEYKRSIIDEKLNSCLNKNIYEILLNYFDKEVNENNLKQIERILEEDMNVLY